MTGTVPGAAPGYALTVVTPPTADPLVSLALAKAQTRIYHAAEDALFTRWVASAEALVERLTGLVLRPQTLRYEAVGWPPDGVVRLPVWPVQAVSAVTYTDPAGAGATVSPAGYATWLAHRPPLVYPAAGSPWPAALADRPIAVEFAAGFPNGVYPPEAKQAMLLLIGYWAENRGDEAGTGFRGDAGTDQEVGLPPGARRIVRSLSKKGYR